jgi:threonine dehydrogenase-like Zn-dependent dehydrogenase
MLSAVLKDKNRLELEDVAIPEPKPDEVLVRVRACGFCATDYKAIRGLRSNVQFPLVPGHEPSGVVAAIGSAVQHLKEGDAVIIQPSGFCGHCDDCRVGKTHYCVHAYTTGGDGPEDVRPGSFAEYVVTGANTVLHKPWNLSFQAACQTEPLSGAWKGVIQMSEMKVGDDVVVIGTGSIGMYCLMVAKAAGAGRLIAIDVSDYALETAGKLGATHLVNPGKEDALQRLKQILPKGPDLVVEAAGPIEAVRLMVKLLRRGTRWNIFGITTHDTFELDGGLMHFLEARMDASFGTNPTAMQQALRLMERGLVDPEQVISHRIALSDIHQAVDIMGTPKRHKIIIEP